MSWEQLNDPTTLMMLAASAVLAAFALAGMLMSRKGKKPADDVSRGADNS